MISDKDYVLHLNQTSTVFIARDHADITGEIVYRVDNDWERAINIPVPVPEPPMFFSFLFGVAFLWARRKDWK